MDGLIDQRSREKIFIVLLSFFYIALVFVQTLLPQIAPYTDRKSVV